VDQDLVAVGSQLVQQVVFCGGEMHLAASHRHLAARQVNPQVASDHLRPAGGGLLRLGALEYRLHPRQQLFGAKGFGDIVIRPNFEAVQFIGFSHRAVSIMIGTSENSRRRRATS